MPGRQPLLALIALLFLPACESLQSRDVRTSREDSLLLSVPAEKDSFQFAIYGDRTGGPVEGIEILRQAVTETNLMGPDLVMTVGDLVQGYNETPRWLEQMGEYKASMAGLDMPWYPVAGNHDIYWHGSEPPPGHHEANYEEKFGPLWYWFPHRNAAFVVLYSDEGDAESNRKGFRDSELIRMSQRQLAWLQGALLETAGYDQVFVFLHHPRWREELYDGGNWDRVHEQLVAAGNVSAVFAGHTHRQRYDGVKDGIAYYTLATIGGLMPMDVPGSGWLNHSLLVTVHKKNFEVATIPVGAVLDPEDMTPEHLQDLDRAREIGIERRSDDLLLGRDGAASGALRYSFKNSTRRPVEISVALDNEEGNWFARPYQRRVEIAPDAVGEIELFLSREADEFRTPLSIPKLAIQVEYLGEKRRVSFPARYRFAPLKPALRPAQESRSPAARAMVLDGSGSGLWFAPDVLEVGPGPFTLEAYVRTDAPKATGVVIGDYDQSGYALMLGNGRPRFVFGREGRRINLIVPEEEALEPGGWHHIAGVFDGAEARLYVDGQLIGETVAVPEEIFRPNELPLFIGGNIIPEGSIKYPFEGTMDELRISTSARYSGEFFVPSRRFEPDPETALLLHLDDLSGPFIRDASFHGRHGIAIGEIQFVAP